MSFKLHTRLNDDKVVDYFSLWLPMTTKLQSMAEEDVRLCEGRAHDESAVNGGNCAFHNNSLIMSKTAIWLKRWLKTNEWSKDWNALNSDPDRLTITFKNSTDIGISIRHIGTSYDGWFWWNRTVSSKTSSLSRSRGRSSSSISNVNGSSATGCGEEWYASVTSNE